MSNDLITQEPGDETPEEGFIEFTTREDYISSAFNAIVAVSDMDTGLMNKADQNRVNRIRRKSLRILDECISEAYSELFEDSDEDD